MPVRAPLRHPAQLQVLTHPLPKRQRPGHISIVIGSTAGKLRLRKNSLLREKQKTQQATMNQKKPFEKPPRQRYNSNHNQSAAKRLT